MVQVTERAVLPKARRTKSEAKLFSNSYICRVAATYRHGNLFSRSMDRLTPEQRSRNMSAIKNKGTKIEVLLWKALWARGLRPRRNDKTVFGKPDFVFRRYKVAVFCDSEFFHGKDWETEKFRIKSRRDFWHPKIEGNMARDVLVNETLKNEGWTVLRFWGNDVKKDIEGCLVKIENALTTNGKVLRDKRTAED
jgi:DNA mismatch endonuclease, patch repair protein